MRGPRAALADTGTCVVESTNEDIRLATMLPETSVLLIRRSTILPGNENGAEVLQKFFGKAEPEFLAFISGPSRTADIERVLTLGVHGRCICTPCSSTTSFRTGSRFPVDLP